MNNIQGGLSADTPLLTCNRGWISVANARIGDRLFHPDGHYTRVKHASEIMTGRNCYRVTMVDGRTATADYEQLWTVTDKRAGRSKGPRGSRVRTFDVRTLTTEDIFESGTSRYLSGGRTVVTDGKRYSTNEYRYSLPIQQPLYSKDAELLLDPYLFGAWLGDGTSASAALTSHIDDVPHWITSITSAGFDATMRYQRPTTVTIGITTSPGAGRQTRSFGGKLRKLGVLGDKHIPEEYLGSGTHQREALLQGLLDTDGTIEARRGQVEFCSTNDALAEGALFLARSLGWRATLVAHRATLNGQDHGPKYRVCFTPTLSDPFHPFRLQRKAQRVKSFDGGKGRMTVSIAEVIPVSSIPIRRIVVDSGDGLFLSGLDLIATGGRYDHQFS